MRIAPLHRTEAERAGLAVECTTSATLVHVDARLRGLVKRLIGFQDA